MFGQKIIIFIIGLSSLFVLACPTERKWCELPDVGPEHNYRLDIYDGVGCHKLEHSETFHGTFHWWPLPVMPCQCLNVATSMHGKIRSLALNQGHIPWTHTEARSEANCNGVVIATSGQGNWVVNDNVAMFKDVQSFFICPFRLLP
ncbi:hypothetical protein BJ138DRAFT_1157924, partial [Hygrophoropsis aurantiaca]